MQLHVYTIAKVCRSFGVTEAVICPGSRSAPLVYAFLEEEGINCHSIVDERSAAFMALGMAQQQQKPVVLISTSGTACLNFFPAIAEAWYQKIPLLVLTADRPPELLNQQDGQMIMQKNVFGKHVRASHELLCYDEAKTDYALTERIVYLALDECSSREGFGPVHINVPLREPLYNIPAERNIPALNRTGPESKKPGNTPLPNMEQLAQAWNSLSRKVILVGQLYPAPELQECLKRFAAQPDAVIFSDVVSNQHESNQTNLFDSVFNWFKPEDLEALKPELIVSIGGPMVSKALKNWLKTQKPDFHFRIQSGEEPIDTYNNVTHFIQADVLSYLNALQKRIINTTDRDMNFKRGWENLCMQTQNKQNSFYEKNSWTEPFAVHTLLQHIPEKSILQLANSSSVRWASWCGIPHRGLEVYGNRGASGIDGSSATAIGAARIRKDKFVTFLSGDLSLFYDQNAFWQNKLPANLRIVVMNNGKGNIFTWIDGPSQHTHALEYFTTSHQLDISLLCRQFGLNHLVCRSAAEMNACLEQLYKPAENPVLLELMFEEEENIKGIKAFRNR